MVIYVLEILTLALSIKTNIETSIDGVFRKIQTFITYRQVRVIK